MEMVAWGLQAFGVFLNFLGALFLAIAYQAVPGEIHGMRGPSGDVDPFVVAKDRWRWRWGLRLLVGGFGVQLGGMVVGLCA